MDNNDDYIHIGTSDVWGKTSSIGVSVEDRRQHILVTGKTGTGKSTLLKNMIAQDLHTGRGVGVIDPHGDLSLEALGYVPPRRADDVVYFNPSDFEYPIGFNLLRQVAPQSRNLVASGVVSTFKHLWRDSWGPRLENTLYASLLALLDCENVSLLGLSRMLTDERYRNWIVRQVKDPLVRAYWVQEFGAYNERFAQEVTAPILNKVGRLMLTPPIRNILGQVERKIDTRVFMDAKRIFIANLSKGLIGEDTANLLGSLLVTDFQLSALSRADMPERQRQDFTLYIDEFTNFTTDSFVSILSEARKYRLSLVLATQFLEQADERIQKAVLGNCGTLISFRVGQRDAESLASEFGNGYSASRFTDLANFEVAAKLLVHGRHPKPIVGKTYPPEPFVHARPDKLIALSRQTYATSRRKVEERISKWIQFRA